MGAEDAGRGLLMPVEGTRSARSKNNYMSPATLERVGLDAVAIVTALMLSLLIRFQLNMFSITEASPLTVGAHAAACVVWATGLLAALAFNRLYDEDTLFPGGGESGRIIRATVEAGSLMTGFIFLTQSFYVSRSWFMLTCFLSTATVVGERMCFRSFLGTRRAGGTRRRAAILVARERDAWREWPVDALDEFRVVARVEPTAFESFVANVERSDGHDLQGAAVMLKARDFTHDEFWSILLLAGHRGWSVFVHSPVRAVDRDRLTVRELGGHSVVKVAPPTLTGWRAVQKRTLDIVLSSLLVLGLAIPMAVIGLTILVTSGRGVLFRQQRVGLNGRTFEMLKFRTMHSNAEAATGPVWTAQSDARCTRVGRFLRRASLDELPQLVNVLKGDMSLVGPRPERSVFVDEFAQEMTWYRFRNRIRPGLTGWAQANGLRGNSSLDSRVQYDNWYVEHWSVLLDIKILCMTVVEVARGRNAY